MQGLSRGAQGCARAARVTSLTTAKAPARRQLARGQAGDKRFACGTLYKLFNDVTAFLRDDLHTVEGFISEVNRADWFTGKRLPYAVVCRPDHSINVLV